MFEHDRVVPLAPRRLAPLSKNCNGRSRSASHAAVRVSGAVEPRSPGRRPPRENEGGHIMGRPRSLLCSPPSVGASSRHHHCRRHRRRPCRRQAEPRPRSPRARDRRLPSAYDSKSRGHSAQCAAHEGSPLETTSLNWSALTRLYGPEPIPVSAPGADQGAGRQLTGQRRPAPYAQAGVHRSVRDSGGSMPRHLRSSCAASKASSSSADERRPSSQEYGRPDPRPATC